MPGLRRLAFLFPLLLALALFLPSVNASNCASPGTQPSSITGYICTVITNTQATTYRSGVTIYTTINALNYSGSLAGNLMNLGVYWSNGTAITTYFAGNPANAMQISGFNSLSKVGYYLYIPNSNKIFTSSNTVSNTIYFEYGAITTDLINGVQLGEEPQLSCNSVSATLPACTTGNGYAKWDNGANVIRTNYANFLGSSAPAGFTTQGGGTITYNNGVSVTGGAYADSNWNFNPESNTLVGVTYGTNPTSESTLHFDMQTAYNDGTNYCMAQWATSSTGFGMASAVASTINIGGGSTSQYSTVSISTNSVGTVMTINYTNSGYIASACSVTSLGDTSFTQRDTGGPYGYLIWEGLYSGPPNGIQPTTATGASSAFSSSGLSVSPNPISYGSTSTLTTTVTPGTDGANVIFNGVQVATGTGSATYTTTAYAQAAGTYNVIGCDTTLHTCTSVQTLTINKIAASPTCTYGGTFVTNNQAIISIYANAIIACNSNTYNGQLTGSYLNYNSVQVATGSSITYNAVWNDLTNTANFITPGNANYTSNSLAFSLVDSIYELISASPSTGPFYETQTQNFVYVLNITKAASYVNVTLDDNSAYYSNVIENVQPGQQTFTIPYTLQLVPSNNIPNVYNGIVQVKLASTGAVLNGGTFNSLTANTYEDYLPAALSLPSNIIQGQNETVNLKITDVKNLGLATVAATANVGTVTKSFQVVGTYNYNALLYSFINANYGVASPLYNSPVTVTANVPVQLSFNSNSVWRNVSTTFGTYLETLTSCSPPTTANSIVWSFNVVPGNTVYTNNVLLSGYYYVVKNTYTSNIISGTSAGITSSATSNTYTTCLYPTWATFSTYGEFQYSAGNYVQSNYYLVNLLTSNVVQSIIPNLYNISTSTAYNIGVQNVQTGQYVNDLVYVLLYNPNTNSAQLVNEFIPPSGGTYATTLNLGSQYSFQVYNQTTGQLLTSTGYIQAQSCSGGCTYIIPLGSYNVPFYQSIIKNIKYNCALTPAASNSEIVSCTYTSINGTSYTTGLNLYKQVTSAYTLQTCSQTTTGASGTLSCTGTNVNSTYYGCYFYVTLNGTNYNLVTPPTCAFGTAANPFGSYGYVLAILVVVVSVSMFITRSPEAGLIAGGFSFIASSALFSLFSLTTFGIGGFIMLIGVVVFVVRNR